MKRAIALIGLCGLLTFSANVTFAEESYSVETEIVSTAVETGDYTPQLIEKIKAERNTIYNSLNLTTEQLKQKDEIDVKRYKELEPQIQKLCLCRKKLKDINTQKNDDKKLSKSVHKENMIKNLKKY